MTILAREPNFDRGLDYLPGKLPITEIDADVDCEAISNNALSALGEMGDDFVTDDCLWRDQLAMCGTFRTLYGSQHVKAAWRELAKKKQPGKFALIPGSARVAYLGAKNAFVECRFEFQTLGGALPTKCSGFLNIIPGPSGSWKLWCLQTILEELTGDELDDLRKLYPKINSNVKGTTTHMVNGTTNGTTNGSTNGTINHTTNKVANGTSNGSATPCDTTRVDAIVIGGGQSGLCNAGYLQASRISYVLIERNKRVGDNWTNRYKSLHLHTPHAFNDLAFGPTFTTEEGYSEWLTTKDLARGYQAYVDRYHINIWLSSNVIKCDFDKTSKLWTLKVERPEGIFTVIGRHLILATGPGGTIPLMPQYRNQEMFRGDIMHSEDWQSADPWKGKKGIVIGTANTGHDVAENMLSSGLSSITMVQRGATFVLPRDYLTTFFDSVWPPGRDSEISDRYFWSPPTAVVRLATMNHVWSMIDSEPERFDSLERVGFKVNRRGDFTDNLLVRFGGHFMDHGASAKIAKGLIKVKSNSAPVAWTSTGLEFADGEVLEADVVVFATGFQKSTTTSAANIVGDEIAEHLDTFWGCDEEGEVQGAFKPCGFPNLWMTGGGCAHARYYTRFVALQIKADLLGAPMEPYTVTPTPC